MLLLLHCAGVGRRQLRGMSGYAPVGSDDTPSAPEEREDAGLLKSTAHANEDSRGTPAGADGWWRWITAAMACWMWLCTYADRTNISLAIVEMEREFEWSASVDGLVLSSFFAGYCTTQVLSDSLSDSLSLSL